MKKKYLLPVLLMLSLLGVVVLFFFFGDSLQFRLLCGRLFRSELTGNTLTLHYTLAYPENYGLDGEAELPCYTGNVEDTSSEDLTTDEEYLLSLLSSLSAISKDRLNETDADTYDLLVRYLNRQLTGAAYTYYPEPFSPNSGVLSGLPILLADYTFRRKEDVEDYLAILDQTDEYLEGLLLYEKEKSEEGLFMPDYAAEEVIRQCSDIMDAQQLAEGTHFLHTTFAERLDTLVSQDILTEQEAEQYLSENDRLLTTVMAPAYEQAADTFTLLMGTGTNEYGLSYFPQGKAYYEYLLASTTGSDRSVSEIKTLLFEDFRDNYAALLSLLSQYPQIGDTDITASLDLSLDNPKDMLCDLQERMQKDFPAFSSGEEDFHPAVTVKKVSSSMENYTSPAYYLTPPIDDMQNNIIYINGKNSGDNLTMYTTLAHEGYPGHLYQTVYSQLYRNQHDSTGLRQILNYGGYVEGWAYYVENLSYLYAENQVKDNAYAASYYEACRLNRNIHLALYSLLDIAIHYDGATPEQAAKILQSIGIRNSSSVTAIYQYIAEEPVNYLKYYLGYLEIELLKEKAKLLWDEDFTLLRFHQFILENGPSDFTGLNDKLVQSVS